MRISLDTLGERALALVQRGTARGLDVVSSVSEVRRGEEIELTVKARGRADGLEAGLICTETYATFAPQSEPSRSDRVLEDALAYESWAPTTLEQTVVLSVPEEAPYTYDGENLKFKWRVAARRRRERGPDAVRTRGTR